MHLALAGLATTVGGELINARPGASVDGVSIDSRSLQPGQLFVAIRAERDGHEFAAFAVERGAAALLVDHRLDAEIPQVVVADTRAALVAAGSMSRERITGAVVGITGSVGKTTAKDMLASILGPLGPMVASEKSLNNELGVPLTLLNAPVGAERAVIEMGARDVGHIEFLCGIAHPTVGVVTTVAEAHLEIFGSIEAIGRAKGELIDAIPAHGAAVLTHENRWVEAMAPRSAAPIWWFGDGGDVVAEQVVVDDELHASFQLVTPSGSIPVRLGVRGRHNISNALAVSAAALSIGVSLDDVAAGLAAAHASPWRMSLLRVASGGVILDDSYNANPASMRSGLAALAEIDARRRTAIVGVMAEIGETAEAEHRAIATRAASLGIELVAVGTSLYGGADDGVIVVGDVDELLNRFGCPDEGHAVLVKASRVARLERIAQAWTASC